MIKPSTIALSAAKKRSKARGRSGAAINLMDVLKALDKLYKRLDDLEKEVHQKRDY